MYAIAQRGARAVAPSSRRCAMRSTLITTPSMANGSAILREAQPPTAAINSGSDETREMSCDTGRPSCFIHSSSSKCDCAGPSPTTS